MNFGKPTARSIGELIAIVMFSVLLCVVTVPLFIAVCVAVVLVAAFHFLDERYAALMVSVSCAFVFMTVEVLLKNLPLENAPQYYRPDEALIQTGEMKHDLHFKPNSKISNFKMPFGDLGALVSSPAFRQKVSEPRSVNFVTDNLGHRNSAAYADQKYVIFGDSFVVGSGTSQEDILSEVLTQKYGLPSYNAGFPGDPFSYVSKVKEMRGVTKTSFQGVLVIFEGNDFKCETDAIAVTPNKVASWAAYIPLSIQELSSYRLFFGLSRRAFFAAGSNYKDEQVKIYDIGQPLAFLDGYVKEAERKEPCWHWVRIVEPLKEIASSIRLIVFVPDKFRIYHNFISNQNKTLLTLQSDFMKSVAFDLGIEYIDLTEPLLRESTELLKESRYTWWRDDTHWNASGIAIGAREIASALSKDSIKGNLSNK